MDTKHWLIACSVCLVVGGAIVFAIGTGYYNRVIDDLSDKIAVGTETNKRLRETNQRLINENRGATERIGKLEGEITENNRRAKEQLDKIRAGLGSVATGLTDSTKSIQDIIDGIECIKDFIKTLPNR